MQTLMSTPIVSFDNGSASFSGQNIGIGALQLYIAASLPLVILTFLGWWLVYWWESRRDRLDKMKVKGKGV